MTDINENTLMCTATSIVRVGANMDGEIIFHKNLLERITWLQNIVVDLSERSIRPRWKPRSLKMLENNIDYEGNILPTRGYVACRKLGWTIKAPKRMYVPDRVYRIAQEQTMRILRSSIQRSILTQAVLDTWPNDPKKRTDFEWKILREAVGKAGIEWNTTTVRNRYRAVENYLKTHNDVLPKNIFGLEDTPTIPNQILLAAADSRFVVHERISPTRRMLKIKLPTRKDPKTRKDWEWVFLEYTISSHVPEDVVYHTPTMRVHTTPNGDKTIRLDVPYSRTIPPPKTMTGKANKGHKIGLGVDWGVNTLLTAVVGSIDDNRAKTPIIRTDGRVYEFGTQGVALKLHRLRVQSEQLSPKIVQLEKLLEGKPKNCLDVEQRLHVLSRELAYISQRRKLLGRAVAWASARWTVNLALQTHATVIYVEDLRTMEGRGCGKKQNVRCSNQIRGIVLEALRHEAAKHGIIIVTVPARGTSSMCPRCLADHQHVKAPDRLSEKGHTWAYCESCGNSANRDHAAAERIVSRGLAAQHSARLDKHHVWRITKIVDVPIRITRTKRTKNKNIVKKDKKNSSVVVRSRDKSGPTRKAPQNSSKNIVGGMRVARTVPVTESLVERPTGTGSSLTQLVGQAGQDTVVDVGKVKVVTRPYPTRGVRRQRRLQSYGFHPLFYPTWVDPTKTPNT